jgi:diaminohydroxyphosphoribosylaminopyrimidine deaminase / 5-amino-6-(5-phosphoribosylamino)uracil reductase
VAGATLYVTLEPCTHHGRTPPCTEFLIEHRPARVVVAMEDPNPVVAGRGIAALRAAGIPVEVGVLEAQARRLNEVFSKYITTALPFVIAKCAMSLDGKIATRTGHSQWVTGEAARRHVHEMRNQVDAILVGSRTVMVDDPSLTTRVEGHPAKDPIRIVLDAADYLLPDRKIFQHQSAAPTWIAVTEDRQYAGAQDVLRVRRGNGGVDMHALMEELGRREVSSVLIEGGGTTLASAFEAGIVDKVCFFIAPKVVGGRDAITPVEGLGAERMDDAVCIEEMEILPIGEDFLVTGYVKR